MIGANLFDRAESKTEYAGLRDLYHEAPVFVPDKTAAEAPIVRADAPSDPEAILPRFKPLISKNEDTVGWIRIEGTSIDYPVVQAEDNDYYLHHSFDRKKNSAGAIFMDDNNDPIDRSRWRNIILYGHHMRDGMMFKGLAKYLDRSFFDGHRVIRFDLLNEEIEWEIFAVYVTDVSFDYIRSSFADDREYRLFQDAILAKSEYDTGVKLKSEDEILTLSTCDYTFDNARLVVHARRIGEAGPRSG